jgi:hypothetical protein
VSEHCHELPPALALPLFEWLLEVSNPISAQDDNNATITAKPRMTISPVMVCILR